MIQSTTDFNEQIASHKGVLFYFATMSCSVGEALEPKVMALLAEKYPELLFSRVDMNASPELSASLQVFVEPTILLFVEQKEFLRKSRHIGLGELDTAIERIYRMAFD